MKRTVYQILMSVLAGTVMGSVVANLVNIMDPEVQFDYGLSIAFFTAITWSLLALLDSLFRKPQAAPPQVAAIPARPAQPRPGQAPAASARR